jgi:hypothetical protein
MVPAQLMLARLGELADNRIAAESGKTVAKRDGDMDRLLRMRSDLLSLS